MILKTIKIEIRKSSMFIPSVQTCLVTASISMRYASLALRHYFLRVGCVNFSGLSSMSAIEWPG